MIGSAALNRRGFVARQQMPSAAHDDGFSGFVQRWFWRGKCIIPFRDILHERALGFIALRGKRIKGVGKPVVKCGERGDLIWRDLDYE